jgi:hypothetical protein
MCLDQRNPLKKTKIKLYNTLALPALLYDSWIYSGGEGVKFIKQFKVGAQAMKVWKPTDNEFGRFPLPAGEQESATLTEAGNFQWA